MSVCLAFIWHHLFFFLTIFISFSLDFFYGSTSLGLWLRCLTVYSWNKIHTHTQNKHRKKSTKQKTCHSNAICCRSWVFHLLDTIVRDKYLNIVWFSNCLSNTWIYEHHIFSIVGLFVKLLQSDNILFHESGLS